MKRKMGKRIIWKLNWSEPLTLRFRKTGSSNIMLLHVIFKTHSNELHFLYLLFYSRLSSSGNSQKIVCDSRTDRRFLNVSVFYSDVQNPRNIESHQNFRIHLAYYISCNVYFKLFYQINSIIFVQGHKIYSWIVPIPKLLPSNWWRRIVFENVTAPLHSNPRLRYARFLSFDSQKLGSRVWDRPLQHIEPPVRIVSKK